MKKILTIISPTNSLYKRLLFSFLIVIVLISSFHIFSFSFFEDSIRQEIIQYNQLNMKNTVDNFESYYDDIKTIIYGLYSNNDVQEFNRYFYTNKKMDYILADRVLDHLSKIKTNNTKLHIDNVMAYYKNESMILSIKGGILTSSELFNEYYTNEYLTDDFWREKMSSNENFGIYPVSTFNFLNLGGVVEKKKEIEILPMKIDHRFSDNLGFIVFVDIDKIFEKLHLSINDKFVILKKDQLVYSSSKEITLDNLPYPKEQEGYMKQGNQYIFYKTHPDSGLTYLNIIPIHNISTKMKQLNLMLFALMILSIGIGVVTSIFLSKKINNPIEKIVESIKQLNSPTRLESNIKEFNFISSNLMEMIETNQEIKKDLSEKNSILRNFAFMNKVKKIQHGVNNQVKFEDDTFIMVIFDIKFKNNTHDMDSISLEQTTNFIRENIDCAMISEYPKSLTIQIENDQILSLIILKRDHSRIESVLQKMKRVFDIDKEYYLVTMGVSSVRHQSSEMTKAYEEALDLLSNRKLRNETQVILENHDQPKNIIMTPSQEQKFYAHMQAGNKDGMMSYIRKILKEMEKEDASASQYLQFATHLTSRVKLHLLSMNLNVNDLENYSEYVKHCYTAEEYERLLVKFCERVGDAIIKQKDDSEDQIVSFVMKYIEDHYTEDVSLDLIADKLKITSSYVSFYFKEKTGIKFSDYLNERRINKAKELLEGSRMKIKDISNNVGYNNVNSFIRMFKNYTGVTPGEYRKNSI